PGAGYLHWQSVILKAHGIGSTNCRNSRPIPFFRAQITPLSRTENERHRGQRGASKREADLLRSQRRTLGRKKPSGVVKTPCLNSSPRPRPGGVFANAVKSNKRNPAKLFVQGLMRIVGCSA